MNSLFTHRPKCSLLESGSIKAYHFELTSQSPEHPDLEYLLFYTPKDQQQTSPSFVITLSKITAESPIQIISFHNGIDVHCDLRFSVLSQKSFLEEAHIWVQKQHIPTHDWAPILRHTPTINSYQKIDYGHIKGYRYQFLHNAVCTLGAYPFMLSLFAPQKKSPSLVLYAEKLREKFVLSFLFRHTHKISVQEVPSATDIFQNMADLAEELLDTPQKQEQDFSIPILQFSLEKINTILRIEKLFEFSLLSVLVGLIGHILFHLSGIPIVGWLFIALSVICWFISSVHYLFSISIQFKNPLIKLPLFALILLPFYLPSYGPTLLLLAVLLQPFLLGRLLRSFGLQTSKNGLQNDERTLLKTRKAFLERNKD